MEQVVWEATLDSVYKIKVVRVSEYQGTITIHKGDELIRATGVPLAYGAVFGPDIDDVTNWQNWAVAVVDGERQPANDR